MMLSAYVDAGLLLPLDLYFAERILSEEEEVKEEQIAFFAFLLALFRQGHIAMPLNQIEKIIQKLPAKDSYDIHKLSHMLKEGAASIPKSCESFIKDNQGVFYLQKNWAVEGQIVFHLLKLLRSKPKTLSHALPQSNSPQSLALSNALESSVSLLFGGPGTGKTYTAAQLIQSFLSLDPERMMRIALAAPTGKAVTQLDAYVRRILPGDNRIRSGTCHALLGLKKEAISDQQTALIADVILVDECSMIDAQLFARLLGAVLEGSRLILIGDPDQLPSVGAGSIFADLVIAAKEGFLLPFTELKKSMRSQREEVLCFAEHIRHGESTQAIEQLQADCNDIKRIDLELKESNRLGIYSFLWKFYRDRFPSFFEEEPKADILIDRLDSFRILSCMRQGCFGVDAINQFFYEQFLKEAKRLLTDSDFVDFRDYFGRFSTSFCGGSIRSLIQPPQKESKSGSKEPENRLNPNSLTVSKGHQWWVVPILITRSDYALQLYNGDSGLYVRRVSSNRSIADASCEDYALFFDRTLKEGFRKISALALPPFEWGYCLSVHKSQGSEYDEVFILIPPGSEVFGREILYTAATRAKRSIACVGSLEVIEKLIQNSARKISGLSARLKSEFNN